VDDIVSNPREWILPLITSLIVGAVGSYVGMRIGLAEAAVRVDFLLRRVDRIEQLGQEHRASDGHSAALERHRQAERRLEKLEDKP